MSEYKAIPRKFVNKGIVQKLDIDRLDEGQFYDLLNATTIQEGALQSRYGSTRLATPSVGSLIHTMQMFRIGNTDAEQFMYLGEGTEIYRVRMRDLSATPTAMSAYLPSWGQRWNAVKFNAGKASKPYFFIAAGQMWKDRAIKSDGNLTTDLERWGIIPPAAALTATVANEISKDIYTGATITTTWTASPDESNTFKDIDIITSSFNLSTFDGTIPSGKLVDFYDSDDYIELVLTPKNPARFNQFILQFDVSTSGGDWNDYYEKVLIPSQATGVIGQSTDPLQSASTRTGLTDAGVLANTSNDYVTPVEGTDGSVQSQMAAEDPVTIGSRPIELPPTKVDDTGTPSPITVKVPKNQFLKVCAAGTTGKNWATVKAVRLWAKSSTVGSVDLTLDIISVKLKGGGGLDNTAAGTAPYEWIYTFRNDATGYESNPCPLMLSDRYIKGINRGAATLTGFSTSTDTQVSSVAIYRRGGVYPNDFRLVGLTDNGDSEFVDTLSDQDILYARIAEFDNDPPVPSALPTSMLATFTGNSGTGEQSVTLSVAQPSGQAAKDFLTVGTRLLVQDNEKTEWIQITGLNVDSTANKISAVFQTSHTGTIKVTTSTVVGAPCRFATAVGESIVLAGDPNNPGMAYKSKGGFPESFPVVVEATENVNQVRVTAPSNPILGLTEYAGEIIFLCRFNIYTTRIFRGQIQTPVEAPAQRGLLCENGWIKADNELFYLSDDGVYSWSGGQSVKKSEAIDWFFKGKTINGRLPLNKTTAELQYVSMAYHQNRVRFSCRDTGGNTITWLYDTIYDRWELYTPADEGFDFAGWSCYLAANGLLYSSRFFHNTGVDPAAYLYLEETGTSDNSQNIPFAAQTGFYSLESPGMNKQWGDIILELTSPNDITVKVYYDYAASPAETFTVTGAAGRRRVPLPFNSGSAKEAAAIAFRYEGSSTSSSSLILHSITFNVLELAEIQRGRASDWSDFGYPHDKRLDQLVIDYDTGGQDVTLNLDTISGIGGSTQMIAVATFTLSGTGRSKATLPIKKASDGTQVICKMLRLRPTTTSTDFKIFGADVTYEKFPADITVFTDPNDYGSPYDKYFQQFLLDIDTGGVAATVDIYIDNASSPSQSLSFTTTQNTRQQNRTLHGDLVGKKARLKITPGNGGKAQLFSHNFVTLPADKGPVLHNYDWDNLGSPNDKRLYSLNIEYEVTQDVNMIVEGLTGLDAAQSVATILSFTLTTSGRKQQQIPLPDNTIVKMVRVRPASSAYPDTAAKIYKYEFDKIVYPADKTLFTEWSNEGYPCEKIFRTVTIDMDTGGVACTVEVQVDGTTRLTASMTTTATDRVRTFSFVSDINNTVVIGKLIRLKLTPGTGGKSQLFNVAYNKTLEPCPQTFFDTFEQYFGSNGLKYMKQAWVEYRSTGTITLKVYRDGGTLFYTKVLSQHTQRDVERFYLPAVNSSVLNKSKSYRITMEADTGSQFYLYRDSSRIETMNLSGESRSPYAQHYLYAEMPLQK